MIKISFILCSFLCVQDEPVIPWSEDYKLSWSDFKASPIKEQNAVAITASGITFGFSIKKTDTKVISFTTKVDAHFYPEQSWYKPERVNNHVLGHEQLHFNITELFARKFRQRMAALIVSINIKNELRTLHKSIQKELAQLQDLYDREADYSRNIENQAKWEAYIASELEKFSKYKSVD